MSPDLEIFLIISLSTLYYLGVGITILPKTMLINDRITGNPQDPNSQSTFIDSTSIMLSTLATILFSKYFSSMGDYIGRRPVLSIACIFSILANIIWIKSIYPRDIYLASIISGICDIYLYVGLSWICDIIPNKLERGKYVGAYIGTVAGLTFSIAIPIGAVLSSNHNIEEGFKASILFHSLSLLGLIFLPIEDTLGIIPRYEPTPVINELNHQNNNSNMLESPQRSPIIRRSQKRHLPPNWMTFFIQHLPFSWQTISLLSKQAKVPQDWINNFLVQSAMKIIRLIILQYFFVVCNFGPLIVALFSIFIGFVAFLTLPIFLSRYTPDTLIFAAVLGSSIGLLSLSLAGTTIDQDLARLLSIIGILLIAISASWHPSFQTIITNQYSKDIMGSVTGVLAINTEFSYFPAYGISLLFPLSLSDNSKTQFIWHGCSFFVSALLCWIALIIHIRSHGWHVIKLTRICKILPTYANDISLGDNNNNNNNENKNNKNNVDSNNINNENNNGININDDNIVVVLENKPFQECNIPTQQSSGMSTEISDQIHQLNSIRGYSQAPMLSVVRGKSSTSTINSDIKVSNFESTPEQQQLFLEEIS